MRVLISGGGTGGHIYPAISIAKKIMEKNSSVDILYVGTEKGLESDIVPKEGIKFKSIRVKGFSRKLSMDTIKSAIELIKGLNDARKVVKEFKPDLVIGTGGYVCGPIVYIAAKKGIPTAIHEQNAFPGATNRILAKHVDRIMCGFKEADRVFKNQSKLRVTGNPIRSEVLSYDREEVRKELKVDDKTVLLSFGGSGGQRSLNEAMLEVIKSYKESKDIKIYHVTGKKFIKSFIESLKEIELEKLPDNIEVMEYCYDLPKLLSVSDLVITSAGAITIAELTALGIPGVIIPKAYTTENHQEYNARALEKNGAAKVFLEKELKDIDLVKELDEIIKDKNLIQNMKIQSEKMGIKDASDRIVDVLNEIVEI